LFDAADLDAELLWGRQTAEQFAQEPTTFVLRLSHTTSLDINHCAYPKLKLQVFI